MTWLAFVLLLQTIAQPITPIGLVYSSTTGASVPHLDPKCTAELCPIYREAAIRLQAKAETTALRRDQCEVTKPALPSVALMPGPSWPVAALLAIATTAVGVATTIIMLRQ